MEEEAQSCWKSSAMRERSLLLRTLSEKLEQHRNELAQVMTLEMGKPIVQSRAEVEKCAWVCRYYAENAADFLEDKFIKTDARTSFVRYAPIGMVLAIMPWNFPLWQVFRFAAPAVMAGNACLLKHAPNTFRSGLWIERLFEEAGFPEGLFQNLLIEVDKVPNIIKDSRVNGITVTGSRTAGSAVGAEAGKHIKKTVMELGGSNAFIVLEDADLEAAVDTGIMGRFLNSGQSCIAAKRFIVVEAVAEAFIQRFQEKVEALKMGDPQDEATFIGPLARVDLAEAMESQVNESIEKGATLRCGGARKGAFYEPTILTDVTPDMPVFMEETFGPLAAITVAKDEAEAVALANQSAYGLGVTVCTKDLARVAHLVDELQGGAVFFNELVKSDPRLPFGGTGISGYGRELSEEGIREFVNAKVIYVK